MFSQHSSRLQVQSLFCKTVDKRNYNTPSIPAPLSVDILQAPTPKRLRLKYDCFMRYIGNLSLAIALLESVCY